MYLLLRRFILLLLAFSLSAPMVNQPVSLADNAAWSQEKKKKKKKGKKKKKKNKKKKGKKGKKKKGKKGKKKKNKKPEMSDAVRDAMERAKKKEGNLKESALPGEAGALDKKEEDKYPDYRKVKKDAPIDLEKRFDSNFEKELGLDKDKAVASKTGIDFGEGDKQSKLINELSGNRLLLFNVWLGGSKSFFNSSGRLSSASFCLNVAASAENCSAGTTGFSFGANGWFQLLPQLKVGGGISYMNLGSATAKFKGNIRDVGIINLNQQFSMTYLSIMPQARFDLSAFYAAAGVAPSFMNYNLSSYESNGTVNSASFEKSNGWAFMALFGFLVPINKYMSFDIFARLNYFTGSVSESAFDPINTSTNSTASTGGVFVVTPGFAFSLYL